MGRKSTLGKPGRPEGDGALRVGALRVIMFLFQSLWIFFLIIARLKKITSSCFIFGFDLTSNKKHGKKTHHVILEVYSRLLNINFKKMEDGKLPDVSKKYMVDEW